MPWVQALPAEHGAVPTLLLVVEMVQLGRMNAWELIYRLQVWGCIYTAPCG